MKNWKKLLAALLCICLGIGVFAACTTDNGNGGDNNGDDTEQTTPGGDDNTGDNNGDDNGDDNGDNNGDDNGDDDYYFTETDVVIGTWGTELPNNYTIQKGEKIDFEGSFTGKPATDVYQGIVGQVFANGEIGDLSNFYFFRPDCPVIVTNNAWSYWAGSTWQNLQWVENTYKAVTEGDVAITVALSEAGVLTYTITYTGADYTYTNVYTVEATMDSALIFFAADGCTPGTATISRSKYQAPAVTYTVNFACDDADVTLPASLTYAEGALLYSHADWTAVTATKENYTLDYWYYLNGDVQVRVNETTVVSDIADANHTVTLYPAFDLTKIELGDYTAEGNWMAPTMTDMTISYGQTVTYTGNITFTGWWHMVAAVISNQADGSVYTVNRFNDGLYLNKTLEDGSQGATAARNNDLGMYFFFTSNVTIDGQSYGSHSEWITPNLFKDNFLNVPLDDYTIVVDYTNPYAIVATVTFSTTKDESVYVFTNVSTYTSTDPHGTGLDQTYYLGIVGDGIGLNNVSLVKTGMSKELPVEADHVWEDGTCTVCGAMTVSYEQDGTTYTGTLEKVANFENYDHDWTWWNGGTSDYSATGDFQTILTWDNFLDTGVCSDIIFEMNAGGDYLDLSPFNLYGENSVDGRKDCWGALIPTGEFSAVPCTTWGEDPTYGNSPAKWIGHYQLTVTRIGTTLTIAGQFTPWGETAAVYGMTYTMAGFTAADLMVRLTGNPAPCNNFVAYYGTLA